MSMLARSWNLIRPFSHAVSRVNKTVFGRHLLLTNSLISVVMGIAGDAVQQWYSINYAHSSCQTKNEQHAPRQQLSTIEQESVVESFEKIEQRAHKCPSCGEDISTAYSWIRGSHMATAGLTTGLGSHYWYIYLDRWLGVQRSFKVVAKKVVLDQIIMSPVNLVIYFGTLSILEASGLQRFSQEFFEKGMQDIFVVECAIWPPAQFFSFSLLPLRYRILWDNLISFGFDIYSPYVKYRSSNKDRQRDDKIDSQLFVGLETAEPVSDDACA